MSNNFDKWIEFLKPENLKGNLISCSLYIATFESFKDYVIDEIKFFYHTGFDQNGHKFSPKYKTSVLGKDKDVLKASLIWLKEQGAIEENDIDTFSEIRKYRNKLTHEMIDLLFEGISAELPKNFSDLISLRVKIEKWWLLNIEIPTDPDFDEKPEVKEDDILTSSQIFFKLILDILSENEEVSNYYRNEFLKYKEQNR